MRARARGGLWKTRFQNLSICLVWLENRLGHPNGRVKRKRAVKGK